MSCRICGEIEGHDRFSAREMMFGLGEAFKYLECGGCGSLFIEDIPDDLARHYPTDYYSFSDRPEEPGAGILKRRIKRRRDRVALWGGGILDQTLLWRFPRAEIEALGCLALSEEARVLDVGCGRGRLLYSLRELGLQRLLGIDPFLESDIRYGNGLEVLKLPIRGVSGEWDLIMFHHSLEHMTDPASTLMAAAELLAPHGTCLVRVPTVPNHVWEKYGANWIQLDPPRHLFIPSEKGMSILAGEAGLEVFRITYDSNEFQFWGSEQYEKGIPLRSERSYDRKASSSPFTRLDIHRFRRRARELNERGEGDQASFYLRRATTRATTTG